MREFLMSDVGQVLFVLLVFAPFMYIAIDMFRSK